MNPDHRRPGCEIECCGTTGALEFYCLDEFSLDGTANAVMLIGSGICDVMNVFTTMSRCVCEQTIASSLMATCCDPHESCVDEHIDDNCDCVSDFQMVVVSEGKGVRKH